MALWAMSEARKGRPVPAAVLALVLVVAARTERETGVARPGYRTLQADLGWSLDTIARTVKRAVELGALRLRGAPTRPGATHGATRGHAVELELSTAVMEAPNLDVLADQDRADRAAAALTRKPRTTADHSPEKAPHHCGPLDPERSADHPLKGPQTVPGKVRTAADPTRNGVVPGTENHHGGGTWSAAVERLREQVSPENWARWLRPTRELSCDGQVLVVAVPEKQWLTYLPYAYEARLRELLPPGLRVEYRVDREHAIGGAA